MSKPAQTRKKFLVDTRRTFLLRATALCCGLCPSQEGRTKARSHDELLGRRVFAHWHIFRRSFDNKLHHEDIYAEYLSPAAIGGKYHGAGGFIRERPLPRQPLADAAWSVVDMVDDIRTAAAAGIDGFQFNIGSVKRDSYLFWVPLLDMLSASERVDLNFSIMLSIDCAIIPAGSPVDDLADALISVANRPAIARTSDGRMILGAFAPERWPVKQWRELIAALAAKGEIVYFAPSFLSGSDAYAYLPLVDAASIWGGNRASQFPAIGRFAAVLRALGKGWIAPIWPQDFRPKDFWYAEANNSRLFRQGWEHAISAKADAVAISTWNDYSEGSEIQPSTSIQYAFYDLTAFYASWYKEQKQPTIIKDILFYFHRIEATGAQHTGALQSKRFTKQFEDPACDEIELLAFLALPGRLEIETNNAIVKEDAVAGITSLRSPLSPGRPVFRLVRNGNTELSLTSAYEVRETSAYQDLLYHSGSSDRPPISTKSDPAP